MKLFKKIKYISHRVFAAYIAVTICLTLDVVFKIVLSLNGKIEIMYAVVSLVFLIAFMSIAWLKIFKPYIKSERYISRLTDGYNLADYSDMPVLTPSIEKEFTRIFEMMNSAEMFDLNKRQAQYLALQNQINPHFLYNTLESIRSEALVGGLENLADMTESLAIFFRYTISKVENLVTIEEELENCKTYFKIQEYRFGDRLNLHILYNQEDWEVLRHYKIPKLTLQPVLENSIIHGTELKIGTGNLKIMFEYTEKRLIIKVSDDGVGMNEQKLRKLNKQLYQNTSKELYQDNDSKGGIALANVNNRIHLLFGEEYGMHIYSIENVGTDVEISMPIVLSENEIRGITNEKRSF